MATATAIAQAQDRTKAISNETRLEALVEFFKAEDEAEDEAKTELRAKAEQEGKSEAEIELMLNGFQLNGEFPGLSPKNISVLIADGLERRRKKRNGRRRATPKGDANLSGTSHHVRELCERFGLLELIDEVQRRGAMEHRYRVRPELKEPLRSLIKFVLG